MQTPEVKHTSRFVRILSQLWDWLTKPSAAVEGMVDRRRARLLSVMTLIFILANVVRFMLFALPQSDIFAGTNLTTLFLIGVGVVIYVMSRSRYQRLGGIIFVPAMSLPAFWSLLFDLQDVNNVPMILFTFIVLSYVIGSIFLSIWGMVVFVIANTILIALLPMVSPALPANSIYAADGILVVVGFLLIAAAVFRNVIEKDHFNALHLANQEQRKLINVIESSPDFIVLTTPEGEAVYANPAAMALTGYTREDLQTHLYSKDVQPDIPQDVRAHIRASGHWAGETTLVCKDGRRLQVSQVIAATRDEHGTLQGYTTTIRDITEAKKAEAALQDSQQRLALLVERSPLAVIEWNRAFEVVSWSPAAERIFGYTRDEAIGRHAASLIITVEGRSQAGQMWQDVLGQTGSLRMVLENTTKDDRLIVCEWNNILLVDNDGKVIGVTSLIDDISDRQRVEKMMQESEQRFRHMAASLQEGLMIIEHGQVVYVNDRLSEIYGYSVEELMSSDNLDLAIPEERERIQALRAEARRTGSTMKDIEFWMERKDGERRYVRNQYSPSIQDGRVVGYFVVVSDITDRKLLEQQTLDAFYRRGDQVQISTQIAQEIMSVAKIDDLFREVVKLVKDRLGYYHTQILRYDPVIGAVVLAAGYGETGQLMLAAGHRLPMGIGLIGTAAATGKTMMRPDLRNDPDWRANPLLPDTQGEIAVPIKLRDQILGVLDVQSDRAGALTEDDRWLLEGLCGQIAVAMEETRLRQEMESRLHELDRVYRSSTRQGWQEYLSEASGGRKDFYFDQTGVQAGSGLWITETRLAMERNAIVAYPAGQGASSAVDEVNVSDSSPALVAVPLFVRGEAIGALAVQGSAQQPLTDEEINLVQAISEQIALAVENARLFDRTMGALSEMEALYGAIAEMNAARSYDEILQALTQYTMLGQAETVLLCIFDRPLSATQTPDILYPVAMKGGGSVEIASSYPVSAFEARPGTLFTDQPVVLEDLLRDKRLDEVTRTLFRDIFLAESAVILPLRLGSEMIGFVPGLYCTPTHIPISEVQRLDAMTGQAAIAVQSHLLLEQAQRRARQEQRIREVTSQVFGASDVPSIMRRAAEQVGRVLGKPAFVYLGRTDLTNDAREEK